MPSLEITTMVGCPLMCTFCPQDQLRGAYGKDPDKYMSLDNFKRILSTVPTYVRIDFSGMAEPWTNEHCTSMLQHALNRGYRVAIYTTLYGVSLMDARRIIALMRARASQIERVCIHLPDKRSNMRGYRPSAEYAEALKMFMRFGDERIVPLSMMTMDRWGEPHESLADIAGSSEHWIGLTRAGALDVSEIGNQEVEATPHYATPVSCSYTPFYDQNVALPNGDVVLCCMDYGLKHVIGNLLTGDYWSLFSSPAMTALKAENQRCGTSDKTICKSCTRSTRYALDPKDHLNWNRPRGEK